MKRRNSKELSLERMKEMDALLGFPSRSFRSIHVGGTNGKGSVSTKIASALTEFGYVTGLFTSPHLFTFRERFQVNEEMISIEQAYDLLQRVTGLSSDLTFFEVMTLMAFTYFRESKVEYAVFEVGLGGTFDATNIIDPKLSIITNITIDHKDLLGDTIDEIAENKAGIIKPNRPVLLGYRAALSPMFHKAFSTLSSVYIMPPSDDWMEENRQIALKAIDILFPQHTGYECRKVPPCRFEEVTLPSGQKVIFDIAHNIDGLEKLFNRLEKVFPEEKTSLIFSMSSDKEVDKALLLISQKSDHIFFFDVKNKRLLSQNELIRKLPQVFRGSLDDFLCEVKESKRLLVVTGSAYLMSEAKEALTNFPLPLNK